MLSQFDFAAGAWNLNVGHTRKPGSGISALQRPRLADIPQGACRLM